MSKSTPARCRGQQCTNEAHALGYCNTHISQYRKYGRTWKIGTEFKGTKKCQGPECDRWAQPSRSYCASHRSQLHRTGKLWVIGTRIGRRPTEVCSEPGCSEKPHGWTHCKQHMTEVLGRCWVVSCDHPATNKRSGLCDTHVRKDRYLRSHYGIGVADREKLAVDQGFSCAICGDMEIPGSFSLHVDHCHSTGVVRGLLCGDCNRGIGMFRDNPRALRMATAYLEEVR